MSLPRIWIIIPSFNAVAVTRSCLADITRQTYDNIAIILSDSGSSDGTRELIPKEFPSVVVVRGNPGWWWTKATNEGVKYALRHAAADDCVMTLNNDVAIPNNYIAEMINMAERYPGSIIGSAIYDAADQSRLVECGSYIDWRTMKYHFLSVNDFDHSGFCEKLTFLCGKGVLYPVSAFRKYSLFDEDALPHYGADQDFAALCKKRGYSLRVQTHVPLYSREEITAAGVREVKTLREKLTLLFIRKSKLNFGVHMRLMLRHCPKWYWPTSTVFLTCRLLGHIFVNNGAQRGHAEMSAQRLTEPLNSSSSDGERWA
jgi:glycosyltransferase involved in cell wall biosynthesis